MNNRRLTEIFSRLWPALILEGGFAFLRAEAVSSREDIGVGLVLALLPSFVAAFRMARGPGFLKTATWAGTLFWIAATSLGLVIGVATFPVEPPLTRGGVAVAFLLAATMLLPVAVVISLLGGVAARVIAKRVPD